MIRSKIGFVSLGCPKNLVDTELMMSKLAQHGAVITGQTESSDFVVINTCGFLDPAKQESMDTIKEFVEKKKAREIQGVIVAGCMTERYLELMSETYPEVDAFLKTSEFSKIVETVEEIQSGRNLPRLKLVGEQLQGHSEMSDRVSRMSSGRPYAYVKISEGCNRTCSFCIIPKLRGKHHSRSISGIREEAQSLAQDGVQELILIAQDLTSYGRDLKDGTNLLELLKSLETVKGYSWYRLMYNYPRFFTDELIGFLAQSQKFSGYIDMPFQHISDSVLKSMRRPEKSHEIRSLIQKLREKLPRLSLRTTLMVGYPGETEEDFRSLIDFVRESEFDHFGVFTFYREPDTASYDLPNQVDEGLKKERYAELMNLRRELHIKNSKKWIGSVQDCLVEALVEERAEGYIYRGRHWGQAPEIDGLTYIISDSLLKEGQICEAEIYEGIGEFDFMAESVAQEELQSIK